jgi:hypothetical protein
MKTFFLKRFGIRLLFLLAFLVTGVVLWYSLTSYLGRREWAAAKKALEARGEKLALADMVPPPLADDLNFAAAPAIAELFEHRVAEGKPGDLFSSSTEPRVPPDKQQWAIVKDSWGRPFRKGQRKANELTDLSAVAANYRAEKRLPEDSRPAAEVVLEVLAPANPLMEEIARYAERPGSRFPVRYEDGLSGAFPHLNPLLSMARYLSLRATTFMELGRGVEAARDIQLILRLADSLKAEPTLISLLVRFSILNIATGTIWEGVARGVWEETQLAALEERLKGCDLRMETAHALRGERAIVLAFLESALAKGGFGRLLASVTQVSTEGAKTYDSPGFRLIQAFYPKGWGYSDLAFISQVHQRGIDALEQKESPLQPDDFEFLDVEMRNWSFPAKLQHLFSALALPSISNVAYRAASTQTGLDEARTALALERFRLTHGDLPASLDALVPQYLDAVPVDVLTAQPLHYRRLGPDDFLLWSVGWDGVDDDGKIPDPETKKGDLVWRRLPENTPPR